MGAGADNLILVRPMTVPDLDFATDLHLGSLDHGLFPALGKRFLKAYLETFLTSPYGVALIAEQDGRPVGFLVGTTDDREHYRQVLRRSGSSLAVRGVKALALRPAVAWRFARTRAFRYARGALRLARSASSSTAPAATSGKDAVLVHMAVAPQCRGRGVGSRLVEAFVENVRRGGLSGIRLITRSGSAGAAAFYEKLGWCPETTFVDQDGLEWQRLRRELGPS